MAGLRGQLCLWQGDRGSSTCLCSPRPSLAVPGLNTVFLVLPLPWTHGARFFSLPGLGPHICQNRDLNLPLPQLVMSARAQKAERGSRVLACLQVPQPLWSLHPASSLSDPAGTATPPAGTLELGPWGQECPWGRGSTENLAYYLQTQSASPGPRGKEQVEQCLSKAWVQCLSGALD